MSLHEVHQGRHNAEGGVEGSVCVVGGGGSMAGVSVWLVGLGERSEKVFVMEIRISLHLNF
jgi:hypothetical protein